MNDLEKRISESIRNMRPFNAKIAQGVNTEIVFNFREHQNKVTQLFFTSVIASLSVAGIGLLMLILVESPKAIAFASVMIIIGLVSAAGIKLIERDIKSKLGLTSQIKQLQLQITELKKEK